ncbi:hypothetical protein YDYSG_37520 [Paenibacillus tyrfis]|uniref:hypothetical protein n=1 Tax=Paenibacillus tyrfis TaxID=1501230 RepID=UPI0024925EA8|nr:hypothetical protein [Paenibacillus tyrfis]GLI07722.1 hypothetical protein YDYSG_37520 [Paenibacillus tyrfis]
MKIKKVVYASVASTVLTFSILGSAIAQTQQEPITISKQEVEKSFEVARHELTSVGVTEETIAKLGDKVDFVSKIVKINNFNKEQAANFIQGIVNPKIDEMISGKALPEGGFEVNGQKEPGFGTEKKFKRLQQKNDVTPSTSSRYGYEMDTGGHYIYTATKGYHKGYMHVQFPQVYLANTLTTRAMEFFGFYHETGGGGDAGLFTRDGRYWKLGMNIYPAPPGTTGWWEGGNIIDKNEHAEVLLVSWEENDTLFTSAFNRYTGNPLSAISFYAPGHGFDKYNPTTAVNNEHSLTFFENQGDITDGSYSQYGKHYNVLLADSNGYTVNWDYSKTSSERRSGTPDEQRTVKGVYGTPFSNEVNIYFDLPRR